MLCALPDAAERGALVRAALAGLPSALDADDTLLLAGSATDGWSGAELRALLAEVAMGPVREAVAGWRWREARPAGGGDAAMKRWCAAAAAFDGDAEGLVRLCVVGGSSIEGDCDDAVCVDVALA